MNALRVATFLTLVLFLVSSCILKSKTEEKTAESQAGAKAQSIDKTSINWQVIPYEKLPYEIRIKDLALTASWRYDLEQFYAYCGGQYNEHKELNLLFSGSTEITNKPWEYFGIGFGVPSTAPGYFFKRLPDVNNNKVLLFAVINGIENFELGDTSPWLELQIFNNKDELIDKMIVFMSAGEGECPFYRDFLYNSNNTFEIRDRVMCYDTDEDETLLSNTTSNYFYQIAENGKIAQKQ